MEDEIRLIQKDVATIRWWFVTLPLTLTLIALALVLLFSLLRR